MNYILQFEFINNFLNRLNQNSKILITQYAKDKEKYHKLLFIENTLSQIAAVCSVLMDLMNYITFDNLVIKKQNKDANTSKV